MKQIIECVPNFSEGRNREVIDKIVAAMAAVEVNGEHIKVLDVDPGATTNRTVVTLVGEPAVICEAAVAGGKAAAELIDMREHHGAHPRSGAMDVCPLIPVSGITLEECAVLARNLAKRLWEEVSIPCYCYGAAASTPERRDLAYVRQGEYEALPEKISDPVLHPDFGPAAYDENVAKVGATNVSARNFLIAVNFNLNTTSTRRAMAVAFDVREKGRKARENGTLTGKVLKDENGKDIWIPGTLKGTKAIGWYIEEYGVCQVTMNINDMYATPLHVAFEEVSRAAAARGMRVTGAEIVGLLPKSALIDAGKFYLARQQRSLGISEEEIIKIAVKSMGLDELRPFNPREKVIEYMMLSDEELAAKERLIRLTCRDFAETTASEAPAPGGGSVSAYMGSLGAALGTMVANLSAHKRGWDDRWEEFSKTAEEGHAIMSELLALVDEDTAAFDKIMEVFAMPKGTPEEKAARAERMEEATLYATQVPLRTMKTCFRAFPVLRRMVENGNPASVSDAGVGVLATVAGIRGAELNVRINAAGLKDRATAEAIIAEAAEISKQALVLQEEILKLTNQIIDK